MGVPYRIVATALTGPLAMLAGLVAVVVFAPFWLVVFVLLALPVGAGFAWYAHETAGPVGVVQAPGDAPEVHAVVERLCVLSRPAEAQDRPRARRRLPNSWLQGTRRRGYRLHLTDGLLETLEPRELEAVIGHELAHIANRDAAVMTIVGGPVEALRSGGLRVADSVFPVSIGGVVAFGIGCVGTLGTRALSRQRELAADAGAVALTGSAAALSSALIKVSDGLTKIPAQDLRVSDVFRLLPIHDGPVATHPPLRKRLEQLEQLERAPRRGFERAPETPLREVL